MTFLKFYGWIVIANVVISWLIAFNVLNTNNVFIYNILDFTYRLTDPFLRKIRAFLPNLGAFDISPIILLVLIEALKIFMFKYIYPYT
ncbi:YggT family protein [Candidatus Pelagibacter sp.]|nr:YggT family protein [Candidatus Pelagibacter sp.]